MRTSGRSQVTPWKPSVSGGLPAPMPSVKRPCEIRCSPAAENAIVAGVRPQTEITDVPSSIRDVRSASSASSPTASCVQPSATSTRSSPSSSARTASRTITSVRVSNGVKAIPTRIDPNSQGRPTTRTIGDPP